MAFEASSGSGAGETYSSWETTSGQKSRFYVRAGSGELLKSAADAGKMDLLITALQQLLKPRPDLLASPVEVCITDSLEAAQKHFSADGVKAVSAKAPSIIFIAPNKYPSHWVRSVTLHLIQLWFGQAAGSAAAFVDGIAGIAASRAGVGPAVREADEWVRTRLGKNIKVSVASRGGDSTVQTLPDKSAPVINEGLNPAATSFVAFLVDRYGWEKIDRYLSQFDAGRKDLAADSAFHHPLAVLEEEWLARLGHRGNVGNTFRTFVKQILPLLKHYKWKQIEIFIYLVLAGAYNIVQPYSIKIFIDRLTHEIRNGAAGSAAGAWHIFVHLLAPFLLLLLALYLLNGVVSLRRAYTVNWLNQNVLNTLQTQMYEHMQRLSHSFYLKAKIGDLMTRLDDDLDNVQSALSQVTNKALYQAFTAIGAITALCLLTHSSPILAIAILSILPLFAINYAALRSRNKQASREQRQRVGQTMADVQQNLSAHAVIKAFRMEDRAISDYASRIRALQKSKLRLAILSAITDLSEDTATALAQLVIFGAGGYLVIRDGGRGLGVGDLAALLVLAKSIFSPVASLAGIGQTMQQATGAMERVSELFHEPITICDSPKAIPLPLLTGNIQLENVTFRYGGERAALRGVTLTLPAGKHIAIVGPSGSGKSSIVNLLLRFWDPDEGRVLFDGNDLRFTMLASLRDQIGLVFQDTFVFDTTLRENIGIGRRKATDAEIIIAAKAAQLDSFIESLPEGYDTIPGENGASLSGGQRQRIAIARAYLRNPRLLILDEATSALDMQTEAGVLETLKGLVKGRTTISVTHRIAQAATADLIIVLEEGRVVQQGTHDSLIEAGGLYKTLYDEATRSAISQVDTAEAPGT